MGIDKFPQELYKSYRNYLMKRYYAFFHVFFLMEITKTEKKSHVFAVAPHAGAWIEMILVARIRAERTVAPHTGAWIEINPGLRIRRIPRCRSPCGGRGLKYEDTMRRDDDNVVAPHAGAWIEISKSRSRA